MKLLLLLELVFLLVLGVWVLPELLLRLLLFVAQYDIVAHIHHDFLGIAGFLSTSIAISCAIRAGGSLSLSLHLLHEFSRRALMVGA